jgi:hypothetical protein
MFEGFKAGSAEAEKEGSNWFTVLGESVGGILGYIFGGLADLVKNGAVWLIRKGFGLEVDKDGKIVGDGIGVKALNLIKEFSFAESIRKLIAMPFHMISNIIGIVGELFTAASNGPGALWEWIQEIPERMSNWVMGMVPEWARDALGIEIGEGGAMSNLSQKQLKKNYGAALRVLLDRSDINPATGKAWDMKSGRKVGVSALIQKYENAFADSEALQAKFIKGEDARNLAQAIREQQGVGDIPQMPAPQITNINYSSGAYGDMFQNLRTTALGFNGQSTY